AQCLACKHLIYRHPAAFECMGRPSHVNAPDAVDFFTDGCESRFAIGFQALDPLPQSSSIVRAQALDVPGLEALCRHFLDDMRYVTQLAARENVAVYESADIAAKLLAVGRILGYAVVHYQTARPQHPENLFEVNRKILTSNVLEHTDARDFVVRLVFGEVAVIEQLHFARIFESRFAYALLRVAVLIFRKRDAGGPNSVALRRP